MTSRPETILTKLVLRVCFRFRGILWAWGDAVRCAILTAQGEIPPFAAWGLG